jgi:thiamine biosynthesis lipoprotein
MSERSNRPPTRLAFALMAGSSPAMDAQRLADLPTLGEVNKNSSPHAIGQAEGEREVTRRRVLRIVAAAAGVPLLIAGVRATAPKMQAFTWRGQVLDAVSELTLWHTDAGFAQATLVRVREEIARLERVFSLYIPESEISRLNAAGRLEKPSPELRALMSESLRLSALSGGAYDISVQPLWRLYEAHFWSRTHVEPDIVARAHDVARALVDFRGIENAPKTIAFARPGMAITLNASAQGYITDWIADMLRNEGFESAVVDLGEFRALGRHPDGRPWRMGIGERGGGDDGPTVELENMALAVSAGYGTIFEPGGKFHHIFDPHTGESANRLLNVAVIGPRATAADGLATALCVVGEAYARALIAAYPGTRAILTRLDGTSVSIDGVNQTRSS